MYHHFYLGLSCCVMLKYWLILLSFLTASFSKFDDKKIRRYGMFQEISLFTKC